MYVVANRVSVKSDWREEFETRFRERAGQIEAQPGFVRMEIHRPEAEDGPYVVLTTWESEEAFSRWVGSDDFQLAHQDPMPKEAFFAPSVMERHTVIISTARSE